MTMPTALPISYYSEKIIPPDATGSLGPAWLIIVWVLVVLLMGAFANPDTATGPSDPLKLLMAF
jgi:hypothetical protein